MINLLSLKKFISEQKIVDLPLILQAFKASKMETLPLLDLLIQKGCVKKCLKTPACATRCFRCEPESFALYQWVEASLQT